MAKINTGLVGPALHPAAPHAEHPEADMSRGPAHHARPAESGLRPAFVPRFSRLLRRCSSSVAPNLGAGRHNNPEGPDAGRRSWNSLPLELLASLQTAEQIIAAMDSHAAARPIDQTAGSPGKRSRAGDLLSPLRLRPQLAQNSDRQQHFVFGYGSLINPCSRIRTLPDATVAQPCLVRGFKREWNYNCRQTYTAVGLVPDSESVVNGVLIPLSSPAADLAKLDLRESDYERTQISAKQVYLLLDNDSPSEHFHAAKITIWTYQSKDPSHRPCSTVPLAQSYIDCVLQGARVALGEEFARLFARLTHHWTPSPKDAHAAGFWVDDRAGAATVLATTGNGEARSGRTSPVSNGLLNFAGLDAVTAPCTTKRRYTGREIERADVAWIDQLLEAELGHAFSFRVPDYMA